MATKTIPQLVSKGGQLDGSDVFEITTQINGLPVSRSLSGDDIINAVNNPTQEFKILSGGIAWSGTGMVYNQSLITYTVDGQQFNVAQTTFTVSNGDATHPRIDIRVLNDSGVASTKEGSPTASPTAPILLENEVLIGSILVPAGATTFVGVIGQDIVYDENVEAWVISSAGTFDADSTDAPKVGSKCIKVDKANDTIKFKKGSMVASNSKATLSFWLRANGEERIGISVTYRNSVTGNSRARAVQIDETDTTDWRYITLSIASLPFAEFDEIIVKCGPKSSTPPTDDWSLDYIVFQDGEAQPTEDVLNVVLQENGVPKTSTNVINFVGATVDENGTVDTVQSTSATGTVIDFVKFKTFGTVASPETGNVTDDLTNGKINLIQKIYHNNGTAPTYPAGWVKISPVDYVTGTLNIIYAEFVGGTRVEYWITQ